MALTVSARTSRSGPSTASLIRGGAASAAVGIGASLTDYADYGKWLSVAGVLLLILGLHRFGRSGPDLAIEFETEAPARRKKKKRKNPAEDGPAAPGGALPEHDHEP